MSEAVRPLERLGRGLGLRPQERDALATLDPALLERLADALRARPQGLSLRQAAE
jgi:hypothetical protein